MLSSGSIIPRIYDSQYKKDFFSHSFLGISPFRGLSDIKAIFGEEKQWYYLTPAHNWRGGNWIHTFPKSISPKTNVMARLEFELAYFEATVQHFSHYDIYFPNMIG